MIELPGADNNNYTVIIMMMRTANSKNVALLVWPLLSSSAVCCVCATKARVCIVYSAFGKKKKNETELSSISFSLCYFSFDSNILIGVHNICCYCLHFLFYLSLTPHRDQQFSPLSATPPAVSA
jgi:hypothetical protein